MIDKPIKDSPHYRLIDCLYRGDDVSQCDYIQRWLAGTLDWRFGFKNPRNYSFFVQRFEQARENLSKNQIKPIIIYKLGNKNYIYDGKHRAAMCAYNHVLVPCVVIETKTMFSGVWKEMFDMIRNDKNYAMHQEMYNLFIMQEVE